MGPACTAEVTPLLLHMGQAALRDTRIPLVEAREAAGGDADAEPELELDDDPGHAKPVDTRRVPVVVTASQVRLGLGWGVARPARALPDVAGCA